MNEETTAAENETNGPSIFDQSPNVDWMLANLIFYAEHGYEIGVTLLVGGQSVSGNVISGRKYFEGISELMANAAFKGSDDNTMSATIAKNFATWKQLYAVPASLDELKPNYIHLSNTQWLNGDGRPIPSNGGVLWRGKLSAVDGYIFGTISAG